MPRYAAFLRGIGPMKAKMPEIKRARCITTRTWDSIAKVARE